MVIKSRQSGFNLVELMVVVGIIGILSAVAVPRFATFKARAQQTEAKSTLNGLFMAMSAYESNYGQFYGKPAAGVLTAAQEKDIGYSMVGQKKNYQVDMITNGAAGTPSATAWSAIARSTGLLTNGFYDSHRINTNKWLCTVFDSVTEKPATASPTVRTGATALNCPQTGTGVAADGTPVLYVTAGGDEADLP